MAFSSFRYSSATIGKERDVSREFKSTLEREIGLDDVPGQTNSKIFMNQTKQISPQTYQYPAQNCLKLRLCLTQLLIKYHLGALRVLRWWRNLVMVPKLHCSWMLVIISKLHCKVLSWGVHSVEFEES